MSDYLAVDLTHITPAWCDNAGNQGEYFPSFGLPWYQGEPPLVNQDARGHRRASRASGSVVAEICFDVKNRGRRHLAEAWIAITATPDSEVRSNFSFDWTPPGEDRSVKVSFSEVISELLYLKDGKNTELGMVIPAAFGPGPQDELLSHIKRQFKDVQFVPRPVAAALQWCESEEAMEILDRDDPEVGSRIGYLCVTSASLDRWEVARVPIRVEEINGRKYLCPVHDRTGKTVDMPFVGLAWEGAKNWAQGKSEAEVFLEWMQAEQQLDHQMSSDGYRAVSKILENRLPGWNPPQITMLVPAEFGLGAHDPDRLACLHSGIWQDDQLPYPLRDVIQGDVVSLPADVLAGCSIAMKRLQKGQIPFFEALAPLDLYVQEKNRFQDPIDTWEPLLEAEEIPAGQPYRTPKPIEGISVAGGGERELELFVRRECAGVKQIFKAVTQVRHDQPAREPVHVIAEVWPGKGLARVEINSVRTRGLINAWLLIDRLKPAEKPTLKYSWPPGSAAVIAHDSMLFSAIPLIRRLETQVGSNGAGVNPDLLKRIREADVNSWPSPQDKNVRIPIQRLQATDEVDERFVYIGAFPSSKAYHTEQSEDYANSLATSLEICARSPRKELRRQGLWLASWLYEACPESALNVVREEIQNEPPISGQILACAGNCFTEKTDFKLFFDNLHWCVVDGQGDFAPMWWLRAYRNLARFRVSALDTTVISEEKQEQILRWYLDVFDRGTGAEFLHCCYLAPQILKRRRYARDFLKQGSELHFETETVFKAATRKADGKRLINIECALEFLNKTATTETLERMAAAQQ